ncbi:TetR/AcrR family transcriptional regulator [Stappia sp. WLB 29]|uniref:TetR/AcrR family transcriptional regulator n=1 Tax=Stappia sp. WLB 29 TaxID=2925220 RepID=UPI0020C080BC|nr:TetR/AcrR family transcriptional regulator [Stappia sp. WLB 29]
MTASRPKPQKKTKKALEARQVIMAAAARMMRERGYADTSLRDLAAEVGMKAGSLYYHFASKDELAIEVMRLGVQLVCDAVDEALARRPDAGPRERIVIALTVHLETLLSASDFASAHIRCYPFVPEAVQQELLATRRNYDKVWSAIIRDYLGPQADGLRVRYLRHALIGALNWSLEWFDPARDSVAGYVAALERLLPPETRA